MAQHNFKKNKCLVLGSDSRATLSIVRSLGRGGIEVALGYDRPNSVCKYSRYIKNKIFFPNVNSNPSQWFDRLVNHLKEENYDLVIPTNDSTILPLTFNRDRIGEFAKFAIPDENGFNYVYNKILTLRLAEKLKVPYPKTWTIEKLEEIRSISKSLTFPLVIKPSSSKVLRDGVITNLTVKVAHNISELLSHTERFLHFNPVCLQEFVKGESVGQFLLMKKGDLKAVFQHKRIHQPDFNGVGGGSSYRKSTEVNSALLDYSLRMLQELKWTGVAMVEYIYNSENKKGYLVELNGRFWGSLPLAIVSGVDFPLRLFKMYQGKNIKLFKDYKKSVFARNIARDFTWYTEKFKKSDSKIRFLFYFIGEMFTAILRFFRGKEKFDELTLDDPLPGIITIFFGIKEKLTSLLKKLFLLPTFIKVKRLKLLYNKPAFRKKKLKSLANIIAKHRNNLRVIFVCKGNICRSSMAEDILKSKLKNKKIGFIEVFSSGIFADENNSTTRDTLKILKSHGLKIKPRQAVRFNVKLAKQSDLIFVFGFDQYFHLMRHFPEVKDKIFLLGIFGNKGGDIEIKDPYGGGVKDFEHAFKKIDNCLNNFFSFIEKEYKNV